MRLPLLLPALLIVLASAGCDRAPAPAPPTVDLEAQRLRDEQLRVVEDRIAQLEDLERRAAEREAALLAAQTEEERARITGERDALRTQRDRLSRERQDAEARAAANLKAARAADSRADKAEKAREETAQRAQSDGARRTVEFFYDALEPHGDWVDVEGFGYSWRPAVGRKAGWRPYTDGRWVHTEYGWTWKSNEPFGWATYHYGRWTHTRRHGWLWVPGSEWGPGWVAWRKSPEYVGWAPLPPEAWSRTGFNGAVDNYYDIGPASYTFVKAEALGEPTYIGRVVEPERNVTIINKTTNITNITYTKVENVSVAYNTGPDLEEVNTRVERAVPVLRVERNTEQRDLRNAEAGEIRGEVLTLRAPRIDVNVNLAVPVVLRAAEKVVRGDIERGWRDDGDREETKRVREQVREEAKVAEQEERREERQPRAARRRPEAQPVAVQAAAPAPEPLPQATPAPRATPVPVKKPAATREPVAATPAKVTLAPIKPIPRATPVMEEKPAPTPATPTAAATPARPPVEEPKEPATLQPVASTPRPKPLRAATPAAAPATPAEAATPPPRRRDRPDRRDEVPATSAAQPGEPAMPPPAKSTPKPQPGPAATPAAAPAASVEAATPPPRGRDRLNRQDEVPATPPSAMSTPKPEPGPAAAPSASAEAEPPEARRRMRVINQPTPDVDVSGSGPGPTDASIHGERRTRLINDKNERTTPVPAAPPGETDPTPAKGSGKEGAASATPPNSATAPPDRKAPRARKDRPADEAIPPPAAIETPIPN